MTRSYLDESALFLEGTKDEQQDLLDDLVDLLTHIHDQKSLDDVVLWCLDGTYNTMILPETSLMDFLYSGGAHALGLRDQGMRLAIALESCTAWDSEPWRFEVNAHPITLNAAVLDSPTIAQAFTAAAQLDEPVCLISLRSARKTQQLSVTMDGQTQQLWSINVIQDRRLFVRSWLRDAKCTPESLIPHIHIAFPDLLWVEDAERGLHRHSTCFFGDRLDTTITHLGVLNDHCAKIFASYPQPQDREQNLKARRVDASPESPSTMANASAKAQRRINWRGQNTYFWWHTKVRYDQGRIHFHHDPTSTDAHPHGQIVIGICTDHLDT